ncbi:beta-ketoacyl synthase chain length factor [Ideonella sp.]|uniref:beta-ketoacyl synthase chain length factor n=1 Tax=Ideonella sp. TaxID=1929293 RepID=UPI002B464382|nr:beta-ketoacyl synthase chain length factor [Ideonella sp.]HJV72166.1 beta-ketoacyl synthase chain length factor [Ideonella sp.]
MNPPVEVNIVGVGLLAPGLAGWAEAAARLRDPASWAVAPTVLPPPARLPPAERRRSGSVVKLSLAVADEALAMASARTGHAFDPAGVATVFTSSSGDPVNCHALCEALALPERAVSPTRFTNSVHNATAGYWHIATQSRAPSTSLCAYDDSFAAGLLEAMAQCAAGGAPVLLVASDIAYPEPLHALRPMMDAVGVALLLTPVMPAPAGPSGASLRLRWGDAAGLAAESDCAHPGLDALRRSVPAARALPLLQALARGEPSELVLPAFGGPALMLSLAPQGAW